MGAAWKAYEVERVMMARGCITDHAEGHGIEEEPVTCQAYDLLWDVARALRQEGMDIDHMVENLRADLENDPPVDEQLNSPMSIAVRAAFKTRYPRS